MHPPYITAAWLQAATLHEQSVAGLFGLVEEFADGGGVGGGESGFHFGEDGLETVEGGEEFVAVGEENILPHGGVAGGDAGGIEETAGHQRRGLGGKRFDQGGGDEVRQVAGLGQKAVVGGGVEAARAGAEGLPELLGAGEGGFVALRRGGDDDQSPGVKVVVGGTDAAGFAPGQGVRSDEAAAGGDERRDGFEDGPFGRADVGDEAAGRQGRGGRAQKFAEQSDRRGQGQEVGPGGAFGGGKGVTVDGPAIFGREESRFAVSDADDGVGQPGAANGQAEAAAEQSDAENRDLAEMKVGHGKAPKERLKA